MLEYTSAQIHRKNAAALDCVLEKKRRAGKKEAYKDRYNVTLDHLFDVFECKEHPFTT
ncbi:MAG: hypothetical protein ACJAZM_000074 [Cyclobacteriaceae bacterium]